ncbi:MAG: dihydrodipicolinate synthase family protein [Rhodopirellula sp. JB044]|uniref:dihydrodipicolinate synthase family protein n=1 Tax=Rhodopirellula sp. JB044 TaxID=3342844 RepID=UPI00370CDD64
MPTPTLSLRGIVPPLITPLSDYDQLDDAGLERLLTHVIDGGVSGVFLLGTTGEAPSLSYRLRRELIQRAMRIINGRIPVLVGITDTAFVETVELARHAQECGARALVLTTPYYFPAGQTELLGYVRKVVDSVDLPVVLYNMPQLTKVWFEIETLQRLAESDRIIGVKDSSGDLKYFKRLCELKSVRPDWSVLIGPEALLAEAHALGGDGGVNGGANVAPTLFVDCYRALQSGDEQERARCQAKILAFQSIYEIGKYASRHIKATKSAASLIGICNDLPALPFNRFLPPEREKVAAILRDIGLL